MKVIALDMGGTKIKTCIVSDGKIIKSIKTPTQASQGSKKILQNLLDSINSVRTDDCEAIGLSMPGVVDKKGKVIFGGGTLGCLVGLDLKKILEKKTKLKVLIENDANCFALSEAVYGAGRKKSVVVGVIWGTGIGAGIVVNGNLFLGSVGGAGEFGHVILEPSLGKNGSLELLASGKSMTKAYKKISGKTLLASQILVSKDPRAKKVANDAIRYLALGLANLVNTLNPDIVVLGGGVSNAPTSVYKKIVAEVKKHVLPSLTKNLKIVKYKISDDDGVLGVSLLCKKS